MGRERSLLMMFIGMAIALAIWLISTNIWSLAGFAFVYGVFYGGWVAVLPAVVMDYFGGRNVGWMRHRRTWCSSCRRAVRFSRRPGCRVRSRIPSRLRRRCRARRSLPSIRRASQPRCRTSRASPRAGLPPCMKRDVPLPLGSPGTSLRRCAWRFKPTWSSCALSRTSRGQRVPAPWLRLKRLYGNDIAGTA